MKLFFHYCSFGFSNCYVLGTDFHEDESGFPPPEGSPLPREVTHRETAPREAIIVDPGGMDESILSFIENNEYTLRGVLITHDHLNHVHGLRTLKRIYDTEIYAVNHIIRDLKTNLTRDGDVLFIGPFRIGVVSVPGHSSDSAVFSVEHMLFTGDVLTAGMVGRTASTYGSAVQMTALRSKILSLPGDYLVLPGHGPPSTLETERRYNVGINSYERNQKQRPVFRVDI
jgi:glyoxylase-like metal-dependent hydrolase (beta-lactamase superfamily II)